jgi:hypothetical protein
MINLTTNAPSLSVFIASLAVTWPNEGALAIARIKIKQV